VAFLHTCYRITDIDRSVAFYSALGFEEIRRMPIRDEAVNVFMNQPGDGDEPRLELTYNFGVASYELGTAYGHIAIGAGDLDAMLARLAELGIEPDGGRASVRWVRVERRAAARDERGAPRMLRAHRPGWVPVLGGFADDIE
jgi:lactoylglutathione lyase